MISKFSVKKPYTVLVGVVLVIVLGIVSFTRMTTDLLPNISLPYVIVMTTYVGASPETVETVVTKPMEASMATVSNIESISSVSSENYSMVILEFSQSADMNAVSLEIRENLDQIKSYWDDSVGSPIIMKLNPDMLPVMMVAVGMDNMEYAQVSTYVNDTLMPEVESLEGVASAGAIGLLEESVHVIIRQEKVDALNRQIYAAIDEKMREAEEELEDGRQTIADSRQELEDGKKEITDGIRELNDGRTELQEGKEELSKTQEETAAKLAETKNQLLTAKTSLDAAKTTLTTNLTMAKALQAGIEEMDKVIENTTHYISEYGKLIGGLSVSGSDADIDDRTREQINQLKSEFLGSDIVKQMAANEQAASMIDRLAELDWAEPENFQTVYANLGLITAGVSTQIMSQRSNMEQSLNALTNGLGVAAYEATVNQTLATIEENLAKVNSGLIEVEKGELTAAVEFANAASQINLGEYQMELAQAQLDAAQEQIKTGEEQLTEAEKQLQEGQEQLEDARREAYDSADMTEILTVDMIKSLLTAQNFSMPAGYVTEEGIDYLVRVGDKPATLEELETLPLMDLHMDGVPVITLGDVADVFYTDNSAEIYTNVNGSPGCMLSIQKQTGYSTGEVSDLLKEKFADMMEADEDLTVITLMDQGIYIDLVMDSILSNILWGGLLAILILLLFLKDIRPTLVVACSIPVSLVTAIVCMYFSGVTLNIISLSGLALGIGMLVDNSIVVIENIYRMRSEGLSVREAAIEGTKEVSGAIFASTLTTVCVFAPIVFTEGITRQLFVDMGLTIAYSLLASLIIALTVVPALASKMLTKTKEQKEGRFFTALTKGYVKVLGGALKVKSLVLVLSLAMLVISVALAWTNGTAFMSDMDSTQMTVSVQLAKDATLEETAEVTDTVVERIMEIEDVTDVGAMASTSSLALLTGGGNSSTNSTEIYVVASEDKKLSNEEIAQIILEKTADLEAEITVDISSMDMSSMGGSGISIQVRGRDLDTLQQIAGEVAAVVESVEGTTQVSDGMEESSEELRITIDKEKAVQYGLTVAQVYTQIMPRLSDASNATTLEAAEKDYVVYVSNENDTALTRAMLADLLIVGTDEEGKETEIPLSEIAELSAAQSLDSISRADQNRYIEVSAAIADGYNVGKVSSKVEAKLADYQLPEGCSLVFSGENEMINDAIGQILLMLVLAIILMYLIMVAQFQSLMSPFIIMFTIPLAFTGGFLGLLFTGKTMSIIAMIGFVMLSGIIVNNGIVLVDYTNQLRAEGMEKREALIRAGKDRLRPIVMTALTTILGLSTMAAGVGMGGDMVQPMAIVTIGGLIYGTLLTLFVVPCIYDVLNRKNYHYQKEEWEEISDDIGKQ